jgi:hypothetical protein
MSNSKGEYDVIVVGGGTGGVPAAIAAARNGARVLLIEKNGFLGGVTTGGLTPPVWPTWISGGSSGKDKEYFIKGIFAEMLERMSNLDALASDGHTMDEEVLKYVLEEMCLEAGVELLMHSFLFRVAKDKRLLTSVDIANKSGARSISGKVFIDGTGDADLIALAGGEWLQGRKSDGATQPVTMTFRLGGVDTSKPLSDSPFFCRTKSGGKDPFEMPEDVAAIHKEYVEAQKRGEITDPRPVLMYWSYSRPGIVHFNTTRVHRVDATKVEDLTKAEIEGKRQVIQILRLLRKFPAFANAYLVQMSSEIGVRETRRIVGEYTMTKDDVMNGKKFEDGVARGHAPIDIHDPLPNMPTDIEMIYLPEDLTYDIPYRSLVPKDFDNVLIGSRCLSATHEASASTRMIHQLYAVGQAVGVAAALASKQNIPCNKLDVKLLRQTLKKQGAIVWEEGMPG